MSQQEEKSKDKKHMTFTMGGAKLLGYGLVVMFLMVWVFALGVLTGRGDVNRLFHRLGLYKTDLAARLGVTSEGQMPAALPIPQPVEAHKIMGEGEKKSVQEVKETATSAAASPTPKVANVVAAKALAETTKKSGTASTTEAKRTKGSSHQKADHDRSLASKLNFQNSLDTPTHKPAKPAAKKEAAVHTASIAPTSSPQTETTAGAEKKKAACAYQVRVGSYRTAEEADKILADLKKKGFKVSLQQGKNKSGATYIIKTGRYNNKSEAEKITQKLKEAKLNGQIQELKR